MKKFMKKACLSVACLLVFVCAGMTVQAEEATIKTGVYVENIDLSGKTEAEAEAAVSAYVEAAKQTEITLLAADDKEVKVTAEELGLSWENTEVVQEAMQLGTQGNVIERYKVLKDLEHEGAVLDIEFAFDVQAINNVLAEKCVKYDRKAINVSLKRENDAFQIVEGQIGYMLDVETSIDTIYDYMMEEWDHQTCSIPLVIIVDEPKGSAEELAEVKDVLGTFTTSFATSNASRSANVRNGCNLINGVTLYPGEEFSTYKTVSPFTAANGYHMAASFMSGKVVDSIGGGICQVSTTLYNAVLLAELEVTERHNHSMIVAYVKPAKDAAIAESSGKDFRFVNNTDAPIYIESYATDNKRAVVTIYGKETRDPNRKVTYESEVLETINPTADAIYTDAAQPIGYIVTESAHTGYKARLWKVVTENGVEVSREQINSSNYKMTPRSATVGIATADPNAQNELMAAIGTSNIDHVRNVIGMLTAPPPVEDDDDED
ncbi:MAG: VanW family protein [Lachnospiraceae bacterium]|nr:VanW family protein [Lachnospiraceae bacterium]